MLQVIRGSDAPRTRAQYWRRKLARTIVAFTGLNRCGPLATEIVQAIEPVLTIETEYGSLLCRGGHGRLVWRAETFRDEEPETIPWLDSIGPRDCYWDIGANVGLYAIYARKFCSCQVIAFEPESQNYALLIENMVRNGVQFEAMPVAIARSSGFGRLRVPYLTKGGAYNTFGGNGRGYQQSIFSASIDDLVFKHDLIPPTHLKIDVDGNEPEILAGARQTLKTARSVLVEVNGHSEIFEMLNAAGFTVAKRDRANVIFTR